MQTIDKHTLIEYSIFIFISSFWLIFYISKQMLKKLLIYINFLRQLFKNQFFNN